MKNCFWEGFVVGVLFGLVILALLWISQFLPGSAGVSHPFLEAGIQNQIGSIVSLLLFSGFLWGSFAWYVHVDIAYNDL